MPCISHRIWAFIIPLPKELRELWIHYFLLFIFTRDMKRKRGQTALNSLPSMLGGCGALFLFLRSYNQVQMWRLDKA